MLCNLDCLDFFKTIENESVDMILTDPPYGISYKPLRGSNGSKMWGDETVIGDDRAFDPSILLNLNVPTILWGANHYANTLPPSSGWLVWDKTREGIREGRSLQQGRPGELANQNCISQWGG